MRPIRKRLWWLLRGWLVFQLSAVASPVVLGAAESALTEVVCACTGTVHGASCPMHHAEELRSKASKEDGRCVLQSAAGPTDLLPFSPLGGAGIIPQPPSVDVRPLHTSVYVIAVNPLARPDLPDSPPPRS